jgi:tetratricopeptide (TPR) repeat protein
MTRSDLSWKPRATTLLRFHFIKRRPKSTIARGASSASPYVSLAAYYNRTGDTKVALEYAQKAIQLNPKSAGGNFQLAGLRAPGTMGRSSGSLNRAIAANPSASSYHYVLSGVYRRLGKTNEAQEQMEIFRKLEKDSTDFEQKRRESRRARPAPKQDLPSSDRGWSAGSRTQLSTGSCTTRIRSALTRVRVGLARRATNLNLRYHCFRT